MCTRNLPEAAFTDPSPTRTGIYLGSATTGETGFGNFIAAGVTPAVLTLRAPSQCIRAPTHGTQKPETPSFDPVPELRPCATAGHRRLPLCTATSTISKLR